MKIYDISTDFFRTEPYETDPEAKIELLKRMELGDGYNLSCMSSCTHHATHIDAPSHYIDGGITIDKIPLHTFYGPCTVIDVPIGIITGTDAEKIVDVCEKRVLLHGNGQAFLSQSAAFVFANSGIILVGTDASSIETKNSITAHVELLSNNIPILEGINLKSISSGDYLLSAFPIKFDGLEASFTRAVLIDKYYKRMNY